MTKINDEEQGLPKGTMIPVTNLDAYDGESLEEKIDSFTTAHPVAMVNRSWCLFSIDAIDFLVAMGVSVHSIETDVHPQGDAILKYLKKKLSYKTTPLIFIKGKFLGGYEDVNALYSQGTLQRDHLSGLTSVEACEKMASISTTKPLFWFPEKVNANVVRASGVITCLLSLLAAVAGLATPWGQFIVYGLAVDFVLRLLGGSRISPLGIVATVLVSRMEPNPRSGRPKQFATMCGLLFSGLGSVFYLIPFPYHDIIGSVFIGILAICCGMEGFLDFCLGCVFFRIGLQLHLIPK